MTKQSPYPGLLPMSSKELISLRNKVNRTLATVLKIEALSYAQYILAQITFLDKIEVEICEELVNVMGLDKDGEYVDFYPSEKLGKYFYKLESFFQDGNIYPLYHDKTISITRKTKSLPQK